MQACVKRAELSRMFDQLIKHEEGEEPNTYAYSTSGLLHMRLRRTPRKSLGCFFRENCNLCIFYTVVSMLDKWHTHGEGKKTKEP